MRPTHLPETALLSVLLFSILVETIGACPLELPTAAVSINGRRLTVELAGTPQSRRCGLSRRAALGEDRGMLFVYPRSAPRTFWMKDTWIPLSIAFIDESGVIINIEMMSPDQTEIKYRSRLPAFYALEVNQGWFQSRGITVGDRVEIDTTGNIGGTR